MQATKTGTQGRAQFVCLPLKAQLRQEAQKVLSGCAAAIVATGTLAAPAHAGSVAFSNVSDGATVGTSVTVDFAVDGMDVLPAVQGIVEGTGHFHLLVDADEDYPLGKPIPFDATHLHYGKGQTTATVELPAGAHKLALQFANAVHESYGPEYLQTINVTVE